MESTLTSGSILKLLPAIAGGKFPIFVVMIPRESGIGAGGSLSEKWPRRPRNFYKISHWRQLRLLISERWSFRVNEFTHEKFDGGDYWSEFEGLTAETELIAAIRLKFLLLWAYLNYWGNWTSQVTEGLKDISSTQYSTRRTKNMLGGPKEALSKISPRVGWEEQPP